MKLIKNISTGLSALLMILALGSCNDTWDDHYGKGSGSGSSENTIYKIIASDPDLQDFKEVLDSVKIFSNHKITSVRYSDLLDGDQFLTVWAPKNGTFNKDSLLALCNTSFGDSIVEQQFIKNHVARYKYSYSSKTDGNALMMNKKLLNLKDNKLGVSNVDADKKNIVADNGILHIVDTKVPYFYNIYEGLTSLDEFSHIGNFLLQYQEMYFDKDNSLASGIVDGVTVYVDSVFIQRNTLLYRIGNILSEDSVYWMVVPDKNSWEAIYDSVYNYFNYSYIDKADSIQNYWANYSLIQDMVFNPKEQKIKEDSLMSTTYVTNGYSYNVYYRPYDEGGLLNNIKEDMQCSNGVIHKLDYWPFDFTKLFFKPIKLEAERTMNIIKSDYGVYSTNYSAADSISGNAYLKMTPSSNGVKNYVQYNIPNTLSGKYDIAVVILPKTVFDENDRNKDKPFLFSAELTYKDVDGKEQSFEFTDYNNISPNGYVNDPARVDTVFVGSFDFPTCNYAQNNIAVTLKITSIANARQTTTYTKEGYLDFIYLKPHVE